MNHISDLLNDYQEGMNIRDAQIAKALKMSIQFWGRIRNGNAPFPHVYIKPVATILEIKPSLIITALVLDFKEKLEDQI